MAGAGIRRRRPGARAAASQVTRPACQAATLCRHQPISHEFWLRHCRVPGRRRTLTPGCGVIRPWIDRCARERETRRGAAGSRAMPTRLVAIGVGISLSACGLHPDIARLAHGPRHTVASYSNGVVTVAEREPAVRVGRATGQPAASLAVDSSSRAKPIPAVLRQPSVATRIRSMPRTLGAGSRPLTGKRTGPRGG
jgi:hypothetical protein